MISTRIHIMKGLTVNPKDRKHLKIMIAASTKAPFLFNPQQRFYEVYILLFPFLENGSSEPGFEPRSVTTIKITF